MTTRPELAPELLTAKELAQLLNISPRTLWRWAADGTLPRPVRLRNRSTRWRVRDITRFLDGLRPS